VREFRLPDIGEGLAEAEIVKWHVPVGGVVAMDETIVEVETDKAVVEIPSPFAGRVVRHGAAEGEVVRVGEVLVVIGDGDEDEDEDKDEDATWAPPSVAAMSAPAAAAPVDAALPAHAPAEPSAVPPIVGTLSEDAVDLTRSPSSAPVGTHRARALPRVRRLAAASGIDLDAVTGSGPGGRVTDADLRTVSTPDDERRPLTRLRRTIAANLTRAWAEIPHVTAFDEVDATRLLAVRAALQARHHVPISVDALIVAAVAPALKAFPEFNASLEGDELVLHRRLDIGIAVDGPEGLVVATIHDVAAKSLLDLADDVRNLSERGKARTLTPAELGHQTFTVSNIGAVAGGGHGTPIVPLGTVGILSVGRAAERPVARAGRVEIGPVMPLSLSYDHRVVDGAGGRRFLRMVVENVAEPALFLAG